MVERLAGASNPALTPYLRLFSAVVVLVLLVGAGLFFAPGLIQPRWPWSLTPFNTRFLGAFYTAELVMMGLLLAVNRWAPARVVLPMAFLFTALVTAASLLSLDRFDLQRPIARAWFVVYLGALLGSAGFLWRYRALAPVEPRSPPLLWRAYLSVQAGGFTLYGLGLLLAPDRHLRGVLALGPRRVPRPALQRGVRRGGRRLLPPRARRGARRAADAGAEPGRTGRAGRSGGDPRRCRRAPRELVATGHVALARDVRGPRARRRGDRTRGGQA